MDLVASTKSNKLRFRQSERDQQKLLELLSHPWFSRIWIIQEAAVARKLCLICGRKSMEAEDIIRIPKLFRYADALGSLKKKIEELSAFLEIVSFETQGHGRPELLALLHKFRTWEATGPRDKVYALLGLSNISDLRPDYTVSTSLAYKRLADPLYLETSRSEF